MSKEVLLNAYDKVYAKALEFADEDIAAEVAYDWLQARLTPTNEGFVANSEDFVGTQILSLALEPMELEFITNSVDGDIVLNATLSSVDQWVDSMGNGIGLSYTEECLKDFESQINTNGLTLPDIDHKEFDLILSQFSDPQDIMSEIAKRKGLLRNIQAKYNEGKLYIQAKLDKRYKNFADHYKSLSLEALAKREGGKYTGGKILGFTFTNKPKITAAKVISVN